MSDRTPYEYTSTYFLLNVPLSALSEYEKAYVIKYRNVHTTIAILLSEKESILNDMSSTNNKHCSKYAGWSRRVTDIDTSVDCLGRTRHNIEESEPIRNLLKRNFDYSLYGYSFDKLMNNKLSFTQRFKNWFLGNKDDISKL